MVNSCSAYGCNARYKKGLSFFRFPKDEIRRIQWAIAVRRSNWMPSESACLCAKHFQTGRPSRDEKHPDYIPNLFVFNKHKPKRSAKSYERRKACIEKYNESKKSVDKMNSGKTKTALVCSIELSGSNQLVSRWLSKEENLPNYNLKNFISNELQTERSAESYDEKRKLCLENCNISKDGIDVNCGKIEPAAVSNIKFSGNVLHVPQKFLLLYIVNK